MDRIAVLIPCYNEAATVASVSGLPVGAAETHSEEEIKRAVAVGADIIGVNCRDLSNFTVDVSISERLLKAIPDGIVKVAESGIKTNADIARLRAAGANEFLIGTALMKSQDPAKLLSILTM